MFYSQTHLSEETQRRLEPTTCWVLNELSGAAVWLNPRVSLIIRLGLDGWGWMHKSRRIVLITEVFKYLTCPWKCCGVGNWRELSTRHIYQKSSLSVWYNLAYFMLLGNTHSDGGKCTQSSPQHYSVMSMHTVLSIHLFHKTIQSCRKYIYCYVYIGLLELN